MTFGMSIFAVSVSKEVGYFGTKVLENWGKL